MKNKINIKLLTISFLIMLFTGAFTENSNPAKPIKAKLNGESFLLAYNALNTEKGNPGDTSKTEYNYPNKEWWYKETPTITTFWKQWKSFYDLYSSLGSVERGWNMDDFVNSELGEGIINLELHWLKYPDEAGQDVLNFWNENGVKKELHDAADAQNKWASYVPLYVYKPENKGKLYPLVLCFRGGNDPIYSAEGFGFIQLGVKEGFITVIPYNRDPDAIQKLLARIMTEYPVDPGRVYLTGNGNGGLQAIYNALAYPAKFAALGPFGIRPLIRDFRGSPAAPQIPAQVEALKSLKMPLLVIDGQYSSPRHYPLCMCASYLPQIKIDDFNTWLKINNIPDSLTLGKSERLVINSEKWIERQTGIGFPVTWIEQHDGTNYHFGEFYDPDGINLIRLIMVENVSHWHGASYAEVIWDYMKQFSRDPETGKVISYKKDVIKTENNLEITFIKHSTLMIEYNDLVIHVDPVSMFGTDYSKMPKADLILITHEHPDHLDAKAIEQIKTDKTTTILTSSCYKSLNFGEVMANGDHKAVLGIGIDAVPAYNLTATNHPKGVGNGYILQLGGTKIYIAGDTENIPEMSNLKDIDIAFLPMNKPFTMSPEQVAEAAMRIRPKILYPYHYSQTNPEELVKLLQGESNIEVRIRKM